MTTWDTLGRIGRVWETLGQFGITHLELTVTGKDTMGIWTIWERVGHFRTAWYVNIVGWDTLRQIDILQDTTRRFETQKYTLRNCGVTFLVKTLKILKQFSRKYKECELTGK